jgi:hypothetical protein
MANRDDLLACLYRNGHTDASHGITARHLAGRLDCPERRIRELVTELREAGIALCGYPSLGYFVTTEPADVEKYYVEFLLARARHSLWLAHIASKRPLAELYGQMRLPT